MGPAASSDPFGQDSPTTRPSVGSQGDQVAARPLRRSRLSDDDYPDGNPFVETTASSVNQDDRVTQAFDDPATVPFDFDELPDEPTQDFDEVSYEPTLTDLHRDAVLSGNNAQAARPAGPRKKKRPWGRAILAGVLALLLVLGIAAVIGENYARRTANAQISQALSEAFGATANATVADRIILWSLARGRVAQIDINAPEATFKNGDSTFTLQSVKGTARDITNFDDPANARLGSLNGTVLMTWSELSALSGIDVRPSVDGRVQVDRTISVLGADIGVQITALPRVDRTTGRIILEDPKARAASVPIPTLLLQSALDRVNEKLVLPAIPSITYESLTVTASGLELAISGKDVLLSELTPP